MTNVLHVIDTTGPGGAETVFIDLASRLDRQSYNPTVLIRGPGWVRDELQRRGFAPIIIDAKGSFNLRYLRRLIELIRDRRIELVQSHLLGSNLYCSLAGLLTGVPVVSTFHGDVDLNRAERLLRVKLALVNLCSRRVVFVSEHLRRVASGLHRFSRRKTRVIYNGIDIDRFAEKASIDLRAELDLDSSVRIVGCVGNVRQPKGYDVLLEAAALLHKRLPDVRFVIAGDTSGTVYPRLLQQRRIIGLDEVVRFIGFRSDAAHLLANFDVFLLPSVSEGFSISTVEAMAAGLPVIATRSGGPEEIVTDGVDGRLVAPGDPAALADAVARMLIDPDLAAGLGTRARERACARFDMAKMLAAYETLYRECGVGRAAGEVTGSPSGQPRNGAARTETEPDRTIG